MLCYMHLPNSGAARKGNGKGLKREEKRSMSNIYRKRGQQPMRGAVSP
jgi:hypothetical protein